MKVINGRHIFLAHAHEDQVLGKAVERLLHGGLSPRCSVFRSSSDDAINMNLGIRESIQDSHREATIVVALITPHSFHRPWVMFEAGGCYFQLDDARKIPSKHLFVAVANGFSPDALPGPLHGRSAGSLASRRVVRLLVEQIAKVLNCQYHPDTSAVAKVAKHSAPMASGWDSVGQILSTTRIDGSPFENTALLKRAKTSFFAAGMNLWHFTSTEHAAASRRALFKFLRDPKRKKPKARLLLCDPRSTAAILTWANMVGPDYPRHLCESLRKLKKWLKHARKAGFDFDVRVTGFLPLSLSFIDANDPDRGLLVITPVVNKPSRKDRPSFIVAKKFSPGMFQYYKSAYTTLFEERRRPFIPGGHPEYTRSLGDVSAQEITTIERRCEALAKTQDVT